MCCSGVWAYDLFQLEDSEKRRTAWQVLHFILVWYVRRVELPSPDQWHRWPASCSGVSRMWSCLNTCLIVYFLAESMGSRIKMFICVQTSKWNAVLLSSSNLRQLELRDCQQSSGRTCPSQFAWDILLSLSKLEQTIFWRHGGTFRALDRRPCSVLLWTPSVDRERKHRERKHECKDWRQPIIQPQSG